MIAMRRIQLFPAAFYLLTLPVSVAANDWTWTITPYAFLADVHVDVKHNDEQIISSDITLSELIDDLESAIIFHVEGKGDRHGVFADFYFNDYGANPKMFDQGGQVIEAKSDEKVWITDLGGVYYPGKDSSGFGIRYGVRMIKFDDEIDIVSVNGVPTNQRIFDASKTFVDGLLGFHYDKRFTDDWSFLIVGDASTGDTELVWNVQGLFGYHFGARDQYAVRFGYRHMDFELKSDDGLGNKIAIDMDWSGPVVGFSFTF